MENTKRSGITRLAALIFWYLVIIISMLIVCIVVVNSAYYFANYQVEDLAATAKTVGGYMHMATFVLVIVLYKFNKLPWTSKFKTPKQSNA